MLCGQAEQVFSALSEDELLHVGGLRAVDVWEDGALLVACLGLKDLKAAAIGGDEEALHRIKRHGADAAIEVEVLVAKA